MTSSTDDLIQNLSNQFKDLSFERKKVIVYTPYHCPRCYFIWDSLLNFNNHKDYCLLNPYYLQKYARLHKIDRFINSSDIAVMGDLHNIPPGRCIAIRQAGHRQGQFCLNRVHRGKHCCTHTQVKEEHNFVTDIKPQQ